MKNDVIGQKFNKLTVVGIAPTPSHIKNPKTLYVYCDCDCGNKNVLKRYSNVKSGLTVSCGCEYHRVGKRYKDNVYEIHNDYVIGYDFKDEQFFISLCDLEKVKKYTWFVNKSRDNEVSNAADAIKLHRYIMDVTDSNILVDHINHNRNDNRRENLRIADAHLNGLNKSLRKDSKSRVRGVNETKNGKYAAYIRLDGKKKHLGTYETLFEAEQIRLEAEQKYYKEWAYSSSMEIGDKYKTDKGDY